MNVLYFVLIGLCAGWLTGQLTKVGSRGVIGDLIVGVIGAILGGFLIGLVGFSANGLLASLITATLGGVVFTFLLRKFQQ